MLELAIQHEHKAKTTIIEISAELELSLRKLLRHTAGV
jgi:hypothetical protein